MIRLKERTQQVDASEELSALLLSSVEAMSKQGADHATGCRALAGKLNAANADPEKVRAIARDIVYADSADADDLAEKLMLFLARYGYGPGPITARQPDVIRTVPEAPEPPQLVRENLLTELVAGGAYSAVLVADAGVGTTTLLRAVIGAWCRQSGVGRSLTVIDMRGGQPWCGLERIENAVISLPPRDARFLTLAAQAFRELAQEVQSRAARFSINQRSSSLGASRFKPMFLVVDGLSAIAEEVSRLSNKQIYDHPEVGPLFRDFRYCLLSGPAVNVSVVVAGDRLSNLGLTKTALSQARVMGLGAVREGGRGGYRAIDEMLAMTDLVPDGSDRKRLREILAEAKASKQPVVFALSGTPRLGAFNDFRDASLNLGELYRLTRAGT